MARRKGGRYATDLFGDLLMTEKGEEISGMETKKLVAYIISINAAMARLRGDCGNDVSEMLISIIAASDEVYGITSEMLQCLDPLGSANSQEE